MRQQEADPGNSVWFIPYLELEREARAICDYSPALIMGILQTQAYAEAVYHTGHPHHSTSKIKSEVEKRIRQREILDRPTPPSCPRAAGGSSRMRQHYGPTSADRQSCGNSFSTLQTWRNNHVSPFRCSRSSLLP
ncbi:Scr1 family TA system antitoxin-like transcriptional regulator [Streptomyces sp. GS7]|uniref:Scr1 family TA system antitoxin-like transcriptional regulator n=1 Tax=Streptomyces sp. GS7 TaxID=2692234 RepID=UPI003FA7E25C